jgi:uncharacterized protein (DUF362 family)/Pyruvate/2-oxoacid:ferredoxin oxidoreductase delta subunit
MQSTVTVRACDDYSPSKLAEVIRRIFDDLGGLDSMIKSGDRVLLKPNLLMSAAPEKAVVTHPVVVEAVASIVIDCGAKPFIGDSPPLGNLNRVLAKSGYDPFMKKMNVEAVPFMEKTAVEFPENRLFRRLDLAKEIFEFDAVISLPKLKTHTQMLLTLAVKNLFGAVIGTDKAAWHLRAGREFDTFATVLVQIYDKVRPVVSILDGILGMERNGPNSGQPRHLGIIAASRDAIALDSTICRLVGFPADSLLTCVIGDRLGIGTSRADEIEVRGDRLPGFPLTDFVPPKSATMAWNLSYRNPIRRFLENHLITRPEIDHSACEACGICGQHCPPQAISEQNGRMVIDRKKCISCFCCHELCTNQAVQIVLPRFGRFLSKIAR